MNSESRKLLPALPILAVSGFSGSGKTTLIESLLPGLIRQGLRVAVVKHDAHQLDVDRPGKDSARFFQAGADVYLHSAAEHFSRQHADGAQSLTQELLRLSREYDLVFVEGYKHTPLPKVWLQGEKEGAPPEDVHGIVSVLPWNADRVGWVSSFLQSWLPRQWLKTPVYACILAEQNSPLSQDKFRGEFVAGLTENLAADVRNVVVMTPASSAEMHPHLLLPWNETCAWPLSAVLAAMRWNPFAAFLFVHDDDCARTAAVARKMLAMRRPGCRAIFAEKGLGGSGFPLPAYFDFRFLPVLETIAFGNGDFQDVSLQSNIAFLR